MTALKKDLTIIGGGPGGFAAALKAREYGWKTLLIEKEAIGGVCLHRGCIPTKSLIADALLLKKETGKEKERTFPAMLRRKEEIVGRMHRGAMSLLEKEGVSLLHGEAEIIGEHQVRVRDKTIDSTFILVATGSHPRELTGFPFDETHVLSSDVLLQLKEVPKTLLIVGGGPTGCEFATLFHALGTGIVLLEAMSCLLPGHDEEISAALRNSFSRSGIDVHVQEKVLSLERNRKVTVSSGSGRTWKVDKVLVSVGRVPNSHALGLERLNILRNGSILVDERMQSPVSSIFAVGDVTGKWPLAHMASHQGRVAVENMAGKKRLAESHAIPECVFTSPEVARVGWTEKEARKAETAVAVGRSPFLASARAHILGEKEGFVKLIGEARTGRLLGAHLLGAQVTELLGELTLALRMGIPIPELAETIHSHPTLSESIEEAARDFIRRRNGHAQNAFSGVASKTH